MSVALIDLNLYRRIGGRLARQGGGILGRLNNGPAAPVLAGQAGKRKKGPVTP